MTKLLCAISIAALIALLGPQTGHSQELTVSRQFFAVPAKKASPAASKQYRAVLQQVQQQGVTTLGFDSATADFLSGGTKQSKYLLDLFTPSKERVDVNFLLAPSDQLQALAQRIATTVSSESTDNHSVLFDLQKKFQAAKIPALIIPAAAQYKKIAFDDQKGVTIAQGPASISTLSVNESIAAALQGAAPTLQLNERTVQFMPSATVLNNAAARSKPARPLASAYTDVVNAFSDTLQAPLNDEKGAAFVAAAKKYRSAYVEQWPKIQDDPTARDAAAQSFNGLARQGVLKAIYGVPTNFPPPSYEQIYYFSRQVVALRGANVCSGIALNSSWILTAGHCFQGQSWRDVRVTFDLDGRGRASKPLNIIDLWPDPAPGASSGDPIDFAFVRTAQDPDVDALFAELQRQTQLTPFGAEKLCVRTQPLGYKEPVFAVGYPRGESKTVHDYAYVWFPFKVTEQLFNEIAAETYARAQLVGNQYGKPQYADRVRKDLQSAYRGRFEDGQNVRYYYGGAFGTAVRPSFGIDTDTFGGDSGSPVFDRRSQCIVGIFSGGQRDTLVSPEASWKEHEFAAPISEVLRTLHSVDKRQTSVAGGITEELLTAREALLRRINEIVDIR